MLIRACMRGDLATVKMLSEKDKVEHVRDVWGRTPLHYSAM